MKIVKKEKANKLVLENIDGFMVRKVTPFGTSAKVSCPKEYLNRKVYLVFIKDE
ncbi:MAG: DUF2080 family transposase-associated protein [Nanoarchaeota archaeon]|nr:DUF2080 family transposase-associated protein [Nanoarchaeota archaeon]